MGIGEGAAGGSLGLNRGEEGNEGAGRGED